MMNAYALTLIGGIIGFASSIGVLAVTRLWDKAGKLTIYCKRSNRRGLKWGFADEGDSVVFFLPIDYELQNTSNTTRTVRDVAIELYRNNSFIARMAQSEGATHTSRYNGEIVREYDVTYGAENSSYSFVLPPRSIQKQKCLYFLDCKKAKRDELLFDEIRVSYCDEKDKKHTLRLSSFKGNWKSHEYDNDNEWILLKE